MKGTIKNNLISHFYRRLQDYVIGSTLNTKQKWELEINVITDEMWENSLRPNPISTPSPSPFPFPLSLAPQCRGVKRSPKK